MIQSKIILLVATCLTFLIIWMVFLGVAMAYGALFYTQFFYVVARDRQTENIIVAPNSVRTTLAWLYMGADASTAAEIKIEAQLVGIDKEEVAKNYGHQMEYFQNETLNMKTANRIFIDREFEIKPEFERLSKRYFGDSAESISFLDPKRTADRINNWTKSRTNDCVENLINAKNLNSSTTSVVVNTNSFSAKWKHQFDRSFTQDMVFYVNDSYMSIISMMFQENLYYYGVFPEVGARGIEVPLKLNNMSMLILLPSGIRDIGILEGTLKQINLLYFKRKMKVQRIHLYLPKFRIKFNLSVQPVLKELGIKSMFTREANFNYLVDDFKPFSITEFSHYASISIDEFGIGGPTIQETAKNQPYLMDLDLDMNSEIFRLNRPFVFAIKDQRNVYYTGHVAVL